VPTPSGEPREPEDIDREIRINELKHRAEEIAGGEMTAFEAENAPPELVEGFWQHVVDFESAPDTSQAEQLANAGITLSHPDELDDTALTARLWEIIHALAARNTFIHNTDHLSDRELYTHLVTESLHEITKEFAAPGWNCHIDILGGCSEEDIELSMRFYTDDEERARWMTSFPDYVMPPKEKPPFDRDRLLPKAEYD
jgi:hypothetical protein